MRQTLTLTLAWALLSALLLTACAADPRVVTRVQYVRQQVPAALLLCEPEPVPPSAPVSDAAVAAYLLGVAEAGEDCRSRLRRVREVVRTAED